LAVDFADPPNVIPTFTAFSDVIEHTTPNTEVEITLTEMQDKGDEADADGTVVSFVVKTVSTGTLKIGTSAGTATAFDVATNHTIDATNNAYWTPATNSDETQNAFTTVAKDNDGGESATPIQAQVFITIDDNVTPPGSEQLSYATTATLGGNPVIYALTIIPTDDNPPTAPVTSIGGIVDIDSTSPGNAGYSIIVTFNLAADSTSIFTGYWKYGPETGGADHWYDYGTLASHSGGAYDGTGYEITNAGKTLKVYITDGIRGDDDLAANGTIKDPGLPLLVDANGNPIPTLSFWGLLLMSLFITIMGGYYQKKKK